MHRALPLDSVHWGLHEHMIIIKVKDHAYGFCTKMPFTTAAGKGSGPSSKLGRRSAPLPADVIICSGLFYVYHRRVKSNPFPLTF